MADNKIYITARELSDMLGVSMGYAYKIISGNVNKSAVEIYPKFLKLF